MQISLSDAKLIIDRAFSERDKHDFLPMAIVVLDQSGSIRASESQDGTSLIRPKIAHGKAFGAISMGLGSRALFERAQSQPYFIQAMNSLCDGALVPVPGGVLIRTQGGDILGAVGITGDTSDNDELCAVAGIEAAGFVADTGAA